MNNLDPTTVGLQSFSVPVAAGDVFAVGQLVKPDPASANWITVAATVDTNSSVAAVCLTERNGGDPASIQVGWDTAYPFPLISDGAGVLAPGDHVDISGLTAGSVKKSGGDGIAIVVAGSPATAGARVLALLKSADSGAGAGSVTSVGLSMPADFSVAGSPVTTAGTLAVTRATQTANKVLASATNGGAAVPAYRALVAADLPAGTGTVTSVATDATITASTEPITQTGTLGLTLTNPNTWTGTQRIAQATLTDASTVTIDANTQANGIVTLGGNRTIGAPSNLVAGDIINLTLVQDPTGSRTATWNSIWTWAGGTPPVLSTAANAVDTVTGYFDGTKIRASFALAYA